MCGIVGYSGDKKALPILLEGLKSLEYRGYDSAGISLKTQNGIQTIKTKGKIIDLITLITESKIDTSATVGIGHTRWATHGMPNTKNAHPHTTENVALVHNGIIENYREIEAFLKSKGFKKQTDTDTETIAILVEFYLKEGMGFKDAFVEAVKRLKGSFAIASISETDDYIMIAKHESPLVIGVSNGETFIASDVTALIEYTNEFIFLNDGDIAIINKGDFEIFDANLNRVKRNTEKIEWSKEKAQKGGYKHFMIKEIAEEDEAVRNTIQSRIDEDGNVILDELKAETDFLKNIDRITIVACGTSYYAGLSAKPILEKYTGVKVDVEIGSEFRYYDYIYSKNNLFIAISQSGETADTKEPLKMARDKGIKTVSIVNVKESAIARISDHCIYTLAGPEISVASTKAFVSQLAVLYLLAFYIGSLKGKDTRDKAKYLLKIPSKIKEAFELTEPKTKQIAKDYHIYKNFLYLGRGLNYPIALEGALKLKEISYIHAEGYPAGEMKHGPIALIDEKTPTVIVAHSLEPLYSKSLSNCEEIKSRMGKIILISDKVSPLADETVKMPEIDYEFLPFTFVVPLQLLAYYIALFLGNDIDQPRNLAKSVTVE
ncbi:glutamine--fructose-6-phosphate transaminase (isomerizing) [Hippea alviniae]|uniref:glutamine--fructose-6-phosphate transaminase (isomerizing) n=1 Tax=Hippea alviniae TaxID=1279027 RepID=UPI0003B42446|nr:glutamine--fructose-6-phosphate transaminase (isomerizing) [Hippea alviniae]